MLETLNKNESFEYQKLSPEEMKARGILGRLVGPCADFINPTRNGYNFIGWTGSDLSQNTANVTIVKGSISKFCYALGKSN